MPLRHEAWSQKQYASHADEWSAPVWYGGTLPYRWATRKKWHYEPESKWWQHYWHNDWQHPRDKHYKHYNQQHMRQQTQQQKQQQSKFRPQWSKNSNWKQWTAYEDPREKDERRVQHLQRLVQHQIQKQQRLRGDLERSVTLESDLRQQLRELEEKLSESQASQQDETWPGSSHQETADADDQWPPSRQEPDTDIRMGTDYNEESSTEPNVYPPDWHGKRKRAGAQKSRDQPIKVTLTADQKLDKLLQQLELSKQLDDMVQAAMRQQQFFQQQQEQREMQGYPIQGGGATFSPTTSQNSVEPPSAQASGAAVGSDQHPLGITSGCPERPVNKAEAKSSKYEPHTKSRSRGRSRGKSNRLSEGNKAKSKTNAKSKS